MRKVDEVNKRIVSGLQIDGILSGKRHILLTFHPSNRISCQQEGEHFVTRGVECKLCARYSNKKCVRCPATIDYRGPL